MTDVQKQQLAVIQAVAEAIKALGSVPSGELYARVCGYLSLDMYSKVIGVIKGAGLVAESNHVLTWLGPTDSVGDQS